VGSNLNLKITLAVEVLVPVPESFWQLPKSMSDAHTATLENKFFIVDIGLILKNNNDATK